MKKLTALAILFCLVLFVGVARANTGTGENQYFSYLEGESFAYQDTTNNVTITFKVVSGSLTGMGNITTSSTGGTYAVDANSTGTLQVSANKSSTFIYVNDETYNGPFEFSSGFTVEWMFEEDLSNAVAYAFVACLVAGSAMFCIFIVFRNRRE